MRYIVDRFEGEYAVLLDEAEKTINVPRNSLSEDTREGNVVFLTEDGIYHKDMEKTEERKECIRKLMDTLWE